MTRASREREAFVDYVARLNDRPAAKRACAKDKELQPA